MRSITTQTISIQADYDRAFAYLADPMTQKEWAVNFIRDVRRTPDGFLAETPFGETPLAIHADPATGVLDIAMGGGQPTRTRLVRNDDGCEYLFTLLKPKEMPEAAWLAQGVPGLVEELQTLKRILES